MKTTQNLYRLLIVILVFVAATSCSNKDDDNPPPQPTVAELLAHKWFFYKYEDFDTGIIEMADSCTGQTFFDFKLDGTLIFNEYDYNNNHECEHGNPSVTDYTLSADGTRFMSTFGGTGMSTVIIVSIDATTLVLDGGSNDLETFKR